ncbi:hypothetical protein TrRE_jg10224 [Triparma retinervis]|uniref:Uncharacterized protein n=1 Tax=Triparma retinervis TaxID=2557542 RepID=A0A9W6ZDS9_9STRA|nr:hypothetical protein TrRE_jg10224 [Triparma retinervis]
MRIYGEAGVNRTSTTLEYIGAVMSVLPPLLFLGAAACLYSENELLVMEDVEGYAWLIQRIVVLAVVGLPLTAWIGCKVRSMKARKREEEEERDPKVFLKRHRVRERYAGL